MNWRSELLTLIFLQSINRPVVAALFMKNHLRAGSVSVSSLRYSGLNMCFLDLCLYWVTLHLKPLISQGILYIIFFFFKVYIFMCFCTTASYTEQLLKRDGTKQLFLTGSVFVLSDSHSFGFFFVFFISAFCQNAVYSTRLWRQQPHSTDVIGATMCLLNKKYALSAHYVKPRSKKSVQIKTSEWEPVRCFFGLDKLMYRNNALLILSSLS